MWYWFNNWKRRHFRFWYTNKELRAALNRQIRINQAMEGLVKDMLENPRDYKGSTRGDVGKGTMDLKKFKKHYD